MKPIILCCSLLVILFQSADFAMAQPGAVRPNEGPYEYAVLVQSSSLGVPDWQIYYGNERSEVYNPPQAPGLKSYSGRKTNALIGALNYLGEQGYELVSVDRSDSSDMEPVRYFLKRRKQ